MCPNYQPTAIYRKIFGLTLETTRRKVNMLVTVGRDAIVIQIRAGEQLRSHWRRLAAGKADNGWLRYQQK